MNIAEKLGLFSTPPLNENIATTEELYRELMKLAHPDLHPELKNATKITQELNNVKKNWYGLVTVGIKYGLIRRGPMKQIDITV